MTSSDDRQSETPTSAAIFDLDVLPAKDTDLVVAAYKQAERRERRWFANPRRRLRRDRDEALGQAPSNVEALLGSLMVDCDLRAYDTRKLSSRWGRAYYFLGLPAAVLATVAGATGLASTAGRIPAAIVALVSAALTTAATYLNSNENMRRNAKLSAAWQDLADNARFTLLRHGQDSRELEPAEADRRLLEEVIKLNTRKGELLRGDVEANTPSPPK